MAEKRTWLLTGQPTFLKQERLTAQSKGFQYIPVLRKDDAMRCSFTLDHYEEILKIALANKYKFASFVDKEGLGKRTIYLRHDIDVHPSLALGVAAIEASLNITSTYFLLINSPFYNMFEQEVIEQVFRIIELGHLIGLHFDDAILDTLPYRGMEMEYVLKQVIMHLSSMFPVENVISFHRPNVELLGRSFGDLMSVYEPQFFSDIKYISDSRRSWAEGCPCNILREGRHSAIQLLIHPVWWGKEKSDLQDLYRSILDKCVNDLERYLSRNISPFREFDGQGQYTYDTFIDRDRGDGNGC